MDSDRIISSFCACAFVTDQAMLPLTLNVITFKETVSDSRLLQYVLELCDVLQESILHCSGTEMLQRSVTCLFCFLCHNKTETPFKVNFRIFFVVRSNLVASKG